MLINNRANEDIATENYLIKPFVDEGEGLDDDYDEPTLVLNEEYRASNLNAGMEGVGYPVLRDDSGFRIEVERSEDMPAPYDAESIMKSPFENHKMYARDKVIVKMLPEEFIGFDPFLTGDDLEDEDQDGSVNIEQNNSFDVNFR